MSSEKIEIYYCKKCKKKTKHKISDWEYSTSFGHSHMCMLCGSGESWEENHGIQTSGKYINYEYIEDTNID